MTEPQIQLDPRPLKIVRMTSGKAIASGILGALSLALMCLTGIPAILLGWLALRDIKRFQGQLDGRPIAYTGIGLGSVGTAIFLAGAIILPIRAAVQASADRRTAESNLRQIGIGVHSYHDLWLSVPMPGLDAPLPGDGLSWRVRVLDRIDDSYEYDWDRNEGAVYMELRSWEPWDSPHNSKFHRRMPAVYAVPPIERGQPHVTSYLCFVDDPSAPPRGSPGVPLFDGANERRVTLAECIDGLEHTIMVVEADRDRSVPWMKPADLIYDPSNPKAGLGHVRASGFYAVMGDGAVRFISNHIDDETLRRLILRDDGNPGEL